MKNERTFKPFWLQGLGEVGAPLKNCGVHFDGGYPRFSWFEHRHSPPISSSHCVGAHGSIDWHYPRAKHLSSCTRISYQTTSVQSLLCFLWGLLLQDRAKPSPPQMCDPSSLEVTDYDLFGSDISDSGFGGFDERLLDKSGLDLENSGDDIDTAPAASRLSWLGDSAPDDAGDGNSVKQCDDLEGEQAGKRQKTDFSNKEWFLESKAHVSPDQFMTAHLARAHLESMPKLPWETSPVAKVFRPDYLKLPKYHQLGRMDVVFGRAASSNEAPTSTSSSMPEFVKRRLRMAGLTRNEEDLRRSALQKARTLVLFNPPDSQLGSSLLTAAQSLVEENLIVKSFEDAFGPKSTSTLTKRMSSLWSFAKWAIERHVAPFALTEAVIYEFLNHLRDSGASPSSCSSFLEAVGFIHGVCNLTVFGERASFSGRCKGLARGQLQTKRKRQQAPPLTVPMVRALEKFVASRFGTHKSVIAGHIVFCIYGCARWADSTHVTDIVEYHRGKITLVESVTTHHKAALTDEARTTFLPILCLGAGLETEFPWSTSWLNSRILYRLHDGVAIPSWSDRTGKFLSTPMSSTEATIWLHEILQLCGFTEEEVAGLSSHSFKSTLLSWAAKSDSFSRAERRLLGHHYDVEDRSMLIYSRDSYAPLAVKVRVMLDRINLGRFNPDLPRVDRIAMAVAELESSSSEEESSESSSDEAEMSPSTSLHPHCAVHEQIPGLAEADPELMMVHKCSGVIHLSASDTRFVCGRFITAMFQPLKNVKADACDFSVCMQCKP